MKVYVAAKFENKEEARAAQALLREAGHTITHDWTGEDATGITGAALREYLTTAAAGDVRGVLDADAILLIHDDRGQGLYIEFGMALACVSGPIVVVRGLSNAARIPIFYYLPGIHHVETIEEAVALISKGA